MKKPIKRTVIKQDTLDTMISENKFLMRCSNCGKIHTFVSYDDFKLDEDGYIVCCDCQTQEKDILEYEFDIDYDKNGKMIFIANGSVWNYETGEREYHKRTFTKIISFKECQLQRQQAVG